MNEINRKSGKLQLRRPVIYIICEGSKTEILYFNAFRTRHCRINIVPITSQYRSAPSLVQKVGSTLGTHLYKPEEGDQIWCVFDCDQNTDTELNNAALEADKRGYHAAFSNPGFELWFLYHFTDPTTELTMKSIINALNSPDRLGNYSKSQNVYDALLPYQNDAIQRAKARLESLGSTGSFNVLSTKSNPCTTVCTLVEFLNRSR